MPTHCEGLGRAVFVSHQEQVVDLLVPVLIRGNEYQMYE